MAGVNSRTRADLCPGVLRPWPAEDGALVRIRLIGGALSPTALRSLAGVARDFGDGTIHLTKRANLQLRALPASEGHLDPAVIAAIEATGLLPFPSHELVRNVLVSPLTGLFGGRLDLRPIMDALDQKLCADAVYADLSARFLFVLDDGRGDVLGRTCDLGLVALDGDRVQLRIGADWGPTVGADRAVPELLALARAFVTARGSGPAAPWHVTELPAPLRDPVPADPATNVNTDPPAYGLILGGAEHVEHIDVPDGMLTPSLLDQILADGADRFVVTPWRSILTVAPN